jgi:choline-glycine betaine transporter
MRQARFCDTGRNSAISLQQKIYFIINAYHGEFIIIIIIIIIFIVVVIISFMQGIRTYIPETMSLGNTLLQLFSCSCSWCLYL